MYNEAATRVSGRREGTPGRAVHVLLSVFVLPRPTTTTIMSSSQLQSSAERRARATDYRYPRTPENIRHENIYSVCSSRRRPPAPCIKLGLEAPVVPDCTESSSTLRCCAQHRRSLSSSKAAARPPLTPSCSSCPTLYLALARHPLLLATSVLRCAPFGLVRRRPSR